MLELDSDRPPHWSGAVILPRQRVAVFPMADPRTTRFWLASIQSGLLHVSSLTACWEAIPADNGDVPEHLDRRLARQAVQQNHVTLWQAQQLLAGRTSGFQVDRTGLST